MSSMGNSKGFATMAESRYYQHTNEEHHRTMKGVLMSPLYITETDLFSVINESSVAP